MIEIVALVIGALIVIAVVSLAVSAIRRKNSKLHIEKFEGKFCPMSGKCYLFKHEKLGTIMRSSNPDKAMVFETEADANKIIEEFRLAKGIV